MYQSNVSEWAKCDDSNLSRVQIGLLHQESRARLLNRGTFRGREVLVSKAISAMNKISNTELGTFLLKYTKERERGVSFKF